MKYSRDIVICLLLATLWFAAGCASVGREFPHEPVKNIKIGQTTREEIRLWFGAPWRTGRENGYSTWTYGSYRYGVMDRPATSDLVVRFDASGVVASYSFSTTNSSETQ